MQFASDNWSGASPKVMAALAEAAASGGPAYGGDAITRAVEARFAEIFEREVGVLLVGTGTAANALALSSFTRPGGVVLCHRGAHIATDEAGATEFFSGGMKTIGVDGAEGKVSRAGVETAARPYGHGDLHHGQWAALSITQQTEVGTVYTPGEVAELAALAHGGGAGMHMDGARFANAVAALGVSPADLTWRAGVDVLSFGGTKNGCVAAEAVVFFDTAKARDGAFARQRAGQGYSKAWFIAAQLAAYLDGGHWLDLARHANAAAAKLAAAIAAAPGARLAWQPAGNEIFAVIPAETDARLRAAGARFHPWDPMVLPEAERPGAGEVFVRLVTSWQTSDADVARFGEMVAGS